MSSAEGPSNFLWPGNGGLKDDVIQQDRRTVPLAAAAFASVITAGCNRSPAPPPDDASADGFAHGTPPTVATGGPGTVLGPVGAVPVGGGVVYETVAVVVTRTSTGDLRGFSAVCPHDGCIVHEVADGRIVCPCHGSTFGLDGSLLRGPAVTSLTVRPVGVQRGTVFLEWRNDVTVGFDRKT